MKKRLSILDLWKFIAACKIMVFHLYRLPEFLKGKAGFEFHSWIYVEFFFIVTGYFTYRHFLKRNEENNIFRSGFDYMVKKFTPLMPYVFSAVLFQYAYNTIVNFNGSFAETILSLQGLPFEALLLGEFMPNAVLGQLWFLSAMFLTFPILFIISQLKNKYLVLFISGWFPLFYFFYMSFTIERKAEIDLLRAISGMLLGVFVCVLTEIIKEKRPRIPTKKTRVILTTIEILSLVLAACFTANWYYDIRMMILLLFVVGIGIMNSGYSYTSNIHCRFFSFLGKLSMPMFIWHWSVFMTVGRYRYMMSDELFIAVYFAVTLAVSILSYIVFEKIKRYIKKSSLKNNSQ